MNKMTYINERIAFDKRDDSNKIKSPDRSDNEQRKFVVRVNNNDTAKLYVKNSQVKPLN